MKEKTGKMQYSAALAPKAMFQQLTPENKEKVNRQIEILIASQSSNQ